MDESDRLAWAQTILAGVGLLAVIFAVVGLATELIRRVREHDERFQTTFASRMWCFRQRRPSRIESLIGRQTPALEVPSLECLIEAADRGLWTSSTLDHMSDAQAELTWVPLYETVFGEIAKSDKAESREIREERSPLRAFFDAMLDEHHTAEHSTRILKTRNNLIGSRVLVSCIRKLPLVDSDGKAIPSKKLAKLQSLRISGKKPSIGMVREELVALSIIMGMRIERSPNGLHYSGIGPFGLSVDVIHNDADWVLSLVRGSRIPRHAPSMGSGYTSLMAKHLACGSIPFAESPSWIQSVYLRDDVLSALKIGRCIIDVSAYGGSSLEFLRRLPGDKAVDAYYGLDSTSSTVGLKPGTIVTPTKMDWSCVIAGVAFGGLVPQAHPNVIEAVKFTTAGNVESCVQKLEALVDAVHNLQSNTDYFGPFVSERCKRRGHSFVNYTYPSTENHPRDAAAIFARYMNLLERVVASTSQDPNTVFKQAANLLDRVYQARVKPDAARTPDDITLIDKNLGGVVGEMANTLKTRNISPDDCAELVRCILAAWAATVPTVTVQEHVPWSDQLQTAIGQQSIGGRSPDTLVMDTLPPFVSIG